MSPTGIGPFPLAKFPAHLDASAATLPQPEYVPDMSWYVGYGERHGGEGRGGRLLSMHTFDRPWESWEVHPEGSEVVLVTSGAMTLHQERDGVVTTLRVRAGEYVINEPGVWHTADVDDPVTAVFITCGVGTRQRPR